MNRTKITEYIITSIAKHPYLIAFFICMFINPFFYCSEEAIPRNTINVIDVFLITFVIIVGYCKYKIKEISFVSLCFFVSFEIISIFYASYLFVNSEYKNLLLFICVCLIIFMLYYYADKTKYKSQINSLLIIGIGFALCFYYIMGTSLFQRQNDVWYFEKINGRIVNSGGYVFYIKYIQENYSLPDWDVSKTWALAHPPLHHMICAVWLEINEKSFNIDESLALESLQILSLFYYLCIIILAYKIFRYFKLTGIPLYCSLAIIVFFPAFILLSGSVNNDILSVAFIVGTMLNALYWKQNPTLMNIFNISLCFGLGMMTKVSTGALAPALFFLFVYTFIKSSNKKQLLKQFLLFLIVSIPLGTWFNIRNYVKYKIPFLFVHNMADANDSKLQYIGEKSYFERITDFSLEQFKSIYVQNKHYGCRRNDYNPLIVLMKSALFGHLTNNINNKNLREMTFLNKISIYFFITLVIISLISIFSMFYMVLPNTKNKPFKCEYIFMFIFFITLILALYKHSYNGPYIPYMTFRFITPTAIIGQLFFGLFNQSFNLLDVKKRNIISIILSASFAICSTIFYISLLL